MATRSLLRKHLQAAWFDTIDGAYSDQLINSERGLQVHFCVALFDQFRASNVTRRLFVEPKISLRNSVVRYPDLLICNSKSIIGAVELKYAPRGTPHTAKDINTLLRLGTKTTGVSVTNDRFRGAGNAKRFKIASDAVLCWAGVYSGDLTPLPPRALSKLGKRFLRLDALTQHGAHARIPRDKTSAV